MSNFFSLFKKKSTPIENSVFINPITTELHSHLIPGIDDGIEQIEETIEVLKQYQQLGYKKVITTPHIMGDFYKNGAFNIIPGLEKIRNLLQQNNINIEIEAAAEYMVDELLEVKINNKEILTFGGNKVLIELPFNAEPLILKSVLFELQTNGYQPILAHPERYPYYTANKSNYDQLIENGILFQLNIMSLIGYYSPEVKKTAEYLIDNKMIHLVGSDLHGVRHLPFLEKAIQSTYYRKACDLRLLNNQL